MHHGPVSPEIAAGLLALKKRIDAAKIPSSKLDETVNVAIWNIREFGRVARTKAALHYIAEIIMPIPRLCHAGCLDPRISWHSGAAVWHNIAGSGCIFLPNQPVITIQTRH